MRTYWFIILPVARSVFWVALVLSMVWHWNDFYEPSIYASHLKYTMLPTRLNILVSMVEAPPEELFEQMALGDDESRVNNAVLMAGTFLVILPIIISFSFLQRKFMQGIERTGLTGNDGGVWPISPSLRLLRQCRYFSNSDFEPISHSLRNSFAIEASYTRSATRYPP